MSTIGNRIRRLRLEQGLSQREISAPGVTYAYISRVERGDRHPSITALIHLADQLHTTALYLLTGREKARCPVCQRDP